MPYFIFRMSPEKHLDLLNAFDDFREAKRFAREQRAVPRAPVSGGETTSDTVKMCHAFNEAQARVLLTTEREPRPLGEDA